MNDVNPLCSIAEVEKATIDCPIRTMKCVHACRWYKRVNRDRAVSRSPNRCVENRNIVV